MGMTWKMGEAVVDSCCGARAEKVEKDMLQSAEGTEEVGGPKGYYSNYSMNGVHWETVNWVKMGGNRRLPGGEKQISS